MQLRKWLWLQRNTSKTDLFCYTKALEGKQIGVGLQGSCNIYLTFQFFTPDWLIENYQLLFWKMSFLLVFFLSKTALWKVGSQSAGCTLCAWNSFQFVYLNRVVSSWPCFWQELRCQNTMGFLKSTATSTPQVSSLIETFRLWDHLQGDTHSQEQEVRWL